MKRFKHNIYLIHAFVTLALIGNLSACVEYQGPNSGYGTNGVLSVKGTVSEATVVTRAGTTDSDVDLKEKYLNTLDVFVEHVTVTEGVSNGGDGTIMKQYHLVTTQTDQITEELNKLADHWASEGLVIGEKYNIYVATNNTQTKDTKDLSTFTVADLKALVASEVNDKVAIINEANNNVTWGETTTSGNIYKLYDANPGDARALTSDKKFMMDGVIKNWTPDPTKMDQVFNVTLNRAAAKFVLNVEFDNTFLQSLSAEDVNITGSPAWKFYNFAFGAPVFEPETQGEGVEVHSSDFNIFHNQSYAGNDKHFQIITYSYPNQWTSSDNAPSLVISVMYSDSDIPHYYRIPLVKNTVTEIERNHIYVINATIATRGSELHEDVDEIKDVIYEVLPWNDESNSNAIHNNVESVQHYYFRANPKVYTLRGDGDQSVIINYSKATGTKVNWKLFTYDAQGNQTGVVANDDEDAVRAWFYDADGDFTTTYSDNSGTDWSNMGVNIAQSTENTSGSKGTVTVTSTALNNKAIKYIRLRVYLDEEATFRDGVETLYEDIIIRHFPTDNIQAIDGSWSSYHSASGGTQEVTLTTTLLSEAQSWAEQYGVSYSTVNTPKEESINYYTYSANASDTEHYHINGPTEVSVDDMWDVIRGSSNSNEQAFNRIQNANSQANAFLVDGDYFWGENPSVVYSGTNPNSYINNGGEYDYYTYTTSGYGPGATTTYYLYLYARRYKASYTHSYTYTEYSVTVQMASTGDWVDWDRDANRTYSGSNRKINGNNHFFAKVYDNGIIKAVVVNWNGSDKTYSLKYGNDYDYYYYWNGSTTTYMNTRFNATNNHMYVIQISATSDDYVLGRPILGNPNENQSKDDVVSPAFMIASQLGAVVSYDDAADAATHCRRYMEVAEDGTRYTGWRLPTKSEISIISNYQNGSIGGVTIPQQYRVLTVVLGGRQYWSLSGDLVDTGAGNEGKFLRCVRDLSDEEVDRLNGFDKIQEKYK